MVEVIKSELEKLNAVSKALEEVDKMVHIKGEESAPPPSNTTRNNMKGAQLLLCSLMGASTAAGITLSRWLLMETGDVLLLFANDETSDSHLEYGAEETVCKSTSESLNEGAAYSFQCADNNTEQQKTPTIIIGETLLSIAKSPHLRTVPLVLLIISSTAFVIGIIITKQQLQKIYHDQVLSTLGVASHTELITTFQMKQHQLKKICAQKCNKLLVCMDKLVVDDVLRNVTKWGLDCAWGGILLYSLPEEIFANKDSDKKNAVRDTRRRLIHAADPTLEQIIFRRGGVWDILPASLRDCILNNKRKMLSAQGNAVQPLAACSDSNGGTDTTSDDDEDSSDTPLAASPTRSSSVNANASSDNFMPIQIVHARGDEGKNSRPIVELTNQGGNEHVQQEPSLQPPMFELDRVLRHTSIAAACLFLCHLRASPSTRRAWASVVKVITSLGLVSTAIGAGVLSTLLSSSNHAEEQSDLTCPIVDIIGSQLLNQIKLRIPSMTLSMDSINSRIQWLWEQVRKNKRLQTSLALMVFYGMKAYTRGQRYNRLKASK